MTTLRPLREPLAKIAREELNEDSETVEESVKLLREWIQQHSHLNSRTNSQFLVAFLRANKSSVEAAKIKLEGYYKVRKECPELFSGRNINDHHLKEAFKLGVGLIFPKTNGENGPCISIVRVGCYDPNHYHIRDLMKAGTMIADIQLLEHDNLAISGLLEIMDMANVTVRHLMQMDVSFMKKLVAISEGGTPMRHKGLHFINTPPGFDTIFNIFKAFLGEKSQTRLFSHGSNMESLYNHVPQRLLPAEYGGENSSIVETIEYWTQKIHSYRDYFEEDERFGFVKECQSDDQKSNSSFGAQGTFRSLGIY